MTTTGPPGAEVATDPVPAGDGAAAPVHPPRRHAAATGRSWPGVGAAAGAYLVLSVALWRGVWTSHPTSTTTCGCGDSSLFTWFLAWPAYALSHGLNPFFSTYLFHPAGVNLLANTGEAGLGIVLAPVTWLAGPVATLNVALTLAPALSALTMYVLCRRWTAWWPAAFAAGLLYGFSPFVLVSLSDAHLMLGFAPVPPLVVLCLDELLVRQRWRPATTGLTLGLLALVQFLVGTETLVLVGLSAGFGLVLVLVHGLRHRELLAARWPYAARGAAWAAGSSAVLLAWPAWFALAGPAHFSGGIWGPGDPLSYGGTTPGRFVWPYPASAATTALTHRFGGYQAPSLSGQYLGIGLVVVLAAGLVVFRRDLRLWLFGAVGVAAALWSRGLAFHGWTPWRVVVRLPLMENVVPSRFVLVVYLCAAVMLAAVVDHTRAAVLGRTGGTRSGPAPGRARWPADLAALAVTAVALVPIGAYFAPGLPLTVVPVRLPLWFRTVAPRLPTGQVLLAFPPPFAYRQSAMTWQAVNGMHWAQAGGGGPGSLLSRAGAERAGQAVLASVAFSDVGQTVTPAEVAAVRWALAGWGVTRAVVPDPGPLPEYDRVHAVRSIVVLLTAATGQAPVHQAGAWVWTDLGRAGPPVVPTAADLARCSAGPADGPPASLAASAACVLAAGSPASGSPATGP